MSAFNAYRRNGDREGFTRRIVTLVDLRTLPLSEWSDDELGFRLAAIYPKVDGYEHLTASDEIKAEVASLMDEITRRGYDPTSNLRYNERVVGWGWQPGFDRAPTEASS